MALTAFRRIQIGQESTNGTAVAATKRLVGSLTMNPEITHHSPQDEDASLSEYFRRDTVAQGASLSYNGDATYDDIIHFLAMAIRGGVTPTNPLGSAYLWTFTPSSRHATIKMRTRSSTGMTRRSGSRPSAPFPPSPSPPPTDGPVELSAELFARFPSKASFTGSLDDPSARLIKGAELEVWIDGTWANLGTTQKSSLVRNASVTINSGLAPIRYADGSLDFSAVTESKRHIEASIEMAVGSDAITEYDAWAAGTDRALRLKWSGLANEIETAHTYELQIDIFGKYLSQPTLFTDADGQNIITLDISSFRDGSGNEFEIAVKNTKANYSS